MADTAEQVLRKYLSRMAEIRSAGGATDETSYYSAFETLINSVGHMLNPNVICNSQLKNQGAGHPDFGLYSKKQCAKGEPKKGQGEIPERGVVEAKGLDDDSFKTSIGAQTKKYLDRYGLVLVTNYRDFRLIGTDDTGKPVEREFFSLADDETSFWAAAGTPQKTAKEAGAHLCEFLKRILMNAAPLTRPEDVAWFLASYARDALAIVEEKEATALAPLRQALELALGIKFEGPTGEHFFRSTLVQTLFYGVFSAWIVEAKKGGGKFDWRLASHILTVPMVRSLFEEVAKPTHLDLLGLRGLLDRTGEALNRVDLPEFFKAFGTDNAVQHFYEPFLESFDPNLRKKLGVWYTPREIVKYMVERVDMALKKELDIADGLADKNVYVLDPCCGTGAYVIEVLKKIEQTLRDKGADALLGEDIKEAAQERIFGFDIMSAPFVVAHWQVGDYLESLGSPFDPAKKERPAIYLTNALTGWELLEGPKAAMPLFPELAEERDQADHVKRDIPILVILGNPPYNAFAGTSPEEEASLVEPYKQGLIKQWGIKKFNLDDLYVRFFRIAEREMIKSSRGIFTYVSNYSYVNDPSFVVMRKLLLDEFDEIWIDSMNGDSRETGKRTPDGKPDPSIFSTKYNSAGIRVGTAVGLFVRKEKHTGKAKTYYRDFWGTNKKHELIESIKEKKFKAQYKVVVPSEWNKFSFKPSKVSQKYRSWPKIIDIPEKAPFAGIAEDRSKALISIDRTPLEKRMKAYFDKSVSWDSLRLVDPRLTTNVPRFDAKKARNVLLEKEKFSTSRLNRFAMRPFDIQWCYYSPTRPLWREPRPDYWKSYQQNNFSIVTRLKAANTPEGSPFMFSRQLCDYHLMAPNSSVILPKYLKNEGDLLGQTLRTNLSSEARTYLNAVSAPDPDLTVENAQTLWLHVLAVGYSPKYLSENDDGIANDWPRIPL